MSKLEWFEEHLLVPLFLICMVAGVILSGIQFYNQGTCEERGGHVVYSHNQPMLVGKVWVIQPVYRCKLPEPATD